MKFRLGFWKLFKNKGKKASVGQDSKTGNKGQRAGDSERPEQIKHSSGTRFFKKKVERVHIQVGLDFGTSTTKVVFSQIGRKKFSVLNFNHGLSHYPDYCIPSVAAIDNEGTLLLGAEAAEHLSFKEWDSGLQRLKVIVAGKHDRSFRDALTDKKYYEYLEQKRKPIIPERLTAIYLAHVMKNSKSIISNLPEYKHADLNFAFNICMPIDHIENNRVKPVFEGIFSWAEAMCEDWIGDFSTMDLLELSEQTKYRMHEDGKNVFGVPEAVASFASYLISLRKRKGLHSVIDLGSGTTDVSICNLMRNPSGERCYWYAARNLPKGTINIERSIASYIRTEIKHRCCTSKDVFSCLRGLSHIHDNEIIGADVDALNKCVYKELCSLRDSAEYKTTWGQAYRHLTQDVFWKDVEIFTCGGGSFLPQTIKVFSKPWWPNLNTEYRVSKLPVPDNYDPGESDAPFERMSVAYGLAIPIPKLDGYVLPENSPDHTPPPLPIYEPDSDDFYTD